MHVQYAPKGANQVLLYNDGLYNDGYCELNMDIGIRTYALSLYPHYCLSTCDYLHCSSIKCSRIKVLWGAMILVANLDSWPQRTSDLTTMNWWVDKVTGSLRSCEIINVHKKILLSQTLCYIMSLHKYVYEGIISVTSWRGVELSHSPLFQY